MKRGGVAIAIAIVAAGVAVRLGNAWHFPVLGSYDAFSHFAYIWYVAETGRIPVAAQGWSYFHPPLYYALMAAIWKGLAGMDPLLRLRIGIELVAVLGLVHPLAAWLVVRRRYPHHAWIAWMAAAFLLALPVMVYSAGFLGNEGLAAVTCTLALLALLRVLDAPSPARAVVLGFALGLAMLAKFSAVIVAAAALAALLMKSFVRGRRRGMMRSLVAAAGVMLAVCGPYYARNIVLYVRPFQLARDVTFLTRYVEENQPQARRGPADYLTFDPLVFRRPQWPRGQAPGSDPGAWSLERSMRESVWTGLYANTWFDGFGGWVLPPVTESDGSRRAGQLLLALGVLPTGVVLLGIWSGLQILRRRGWDDQVVVFGLATTAMLALFVIGTHEAPIAAAVKATYWLPVCLPFAFWFALGIAQLRATAPRSFPLVAGVSAAAAAASLVVFAQGLLFDPASMQSADAGYRQGIDNEYAVLEYAGGRVGEAKASFEKLAAEDYPLAVENLAHLASAQGKHREALRLLRRAAPLAGSLAEGRPLERDKFLALTEAEYDHSIAVELHSLGRRDKAVAGWTRALQHDPEHAEALWCLVLAHLEDALANAGDAKERDAAYEDALAGLSNVRALDPGLDQGWTLAAAVEAARGDCAKAGHLVALMRARPWFVERRYAAPAGNGAGLAASIGRRKLIEPHRAELRADGALAKCGEPAHGL